MAKRRDGGFCERARNPRAEGRSWHSCPELPPSAATLGSAVWSFSVGPLLTDDQEGAGDIAGLHPDHQPLSSLSPCPFVPHGQGHRTF